MRNRTDAEVQIPRLAALARDDTGPFRIPASPHPRIPASSMRRIWSCACGVVVLVRDLFRGERALAAHPASHREIEQRDEEDAERRGGEHAAGDARAHRLAARRARAAR